MNSNQDGNYTVKFKPVTPGMVSANPGGPGSPLAPGVPGRPDGPYEP